jgi:hypothetical protein
MSKRIVEQKFNGILENRNRKFVCNEKEYFGATFFVKIMLEDI